VTLPFCCFLLRKYPQGSESLLFFAFLLQVREANEDHKGHTLLMFQMLLFQQMATEQPDARKKIPAAFAGRQGYREHPAVGQKNPDIEYGLMALACAI
jgi:hypothetical protein